MRSSLRRWFAWGVAQAFLAGCSGDQLHLGGSDGGSGCEPGTYLGTYDCNTGADAASLLPMMSGPIVFNLQGERGGATLTIASGAKLTGTLAVPAIGDLSFVADLSGTVDCTTYKLTGQVSNMTFNSSAFMTMVLQNGDLSADYDSTAEPPALVNGVLTQPGVPIFAGIPSSTNSCSWQAALHP